MTTLLAVVCFWTAAARGNEVTTVSAPATQPVTQPAPTTASQPAVSKDVERILENLEKKREQIKDMEANITYENLQLIAEDKQTQRGQIRYIAATEQTTPKFMVYFHTLIHDDVQRKRQLWYCFDGRMLREVNEQTRHAIDREVVRPGERIDPFALGGPFPVPFGQKKSEMLEFFQITLVEPTKDEKGKTDHLLLIPLPKTDLAREYKQIEYWVDREREIPVRIVSEDRHKNIITAVFSDIRINIGLNEKDLLKDVPASYTHEVQYIGN
jgi:outer membrane lipoprotein-sorting protein